MAGSDILSHTNTGGAELLGRGRFVRKVKGL